MRRVPDESSSTLEASVRQPANHIPPSHALIACWTTNRSPDTRSKSRLTVHLSRNASFPTGCPFAQPLPTSFEARILPYTHVDRVKSIVDVNSNYSMTSESPLVQAPSHPMLPHALDAASMTRARHAHLNRPAYLSVPIPPNA